MRTGVAPASGRWANAGGPGNPGVDSGLLAARLGGLSRPAPTSDANTAADGTPVTAELGGTVVRWLADDGAPVREGDPIVVLEAMKMENNIDAERGGVVKSIHVQKGATVMEGDLLIVIE